MRPLLRLARPLPVLAALLLGGPASVAGGGGALAPPPEPNPVLAVSAGTDGHGRPVVAWIAREAGLEHLHAARLVGGGWHDLGRQELGRQGRGGVLNEKARSNAAKPTVHPGPDGSVWLAWEEGSGSAHIDSYVMSNLTPAGWTSPEPYALRRNLSDAGRSRSFVAGGGNRPLVGWTDIGTLNRTYPSVVSLRVWRGTDWQVTPYVNLDPRVPAFMPSVAQAGSRVLLAYVEGPTTQSDLWVRAWDGQRWRTLGQRLNIRPRTYVFLPRLRIDPAGRPVVAWLEDLDGTDALYVSRWDGRAWRRLGGVVSTPGRLASSVSLGFDPRGRPVVAWNEGPDGARKVLAARWEGAASGAGHWSSLGGPLNVNSRADTDHASLAAGPLGVLVAWREFGQGHWRLQARRLE